MESVGALFSRRCLSSCSPMSTESPSTNRNGAASPKTRESFNSYLPYASTSVKEGELADPDSLQPSHFTITTPSKRPRFEGFINFYDAVSWIFGFKEKYSLALSACLVSMADIPPYPKPLQ